MVIVLGKRGKWTLGVLLALVGIYALAGFVWAPGFVRQTLVKQLDRNLGVTPGVGAIKVNPFLVSVEIDDFSIPDAQTHALLGFKRLYVEMGVLRSLLHGSPVFSDIEIDDPYTHVRVSPAGALNFAALQPRQPTAPVAPGAPLPKLIVAQLKVANGVASYEDDSRPTPFTVELKPIEFELHEFSTGSKGGRFTLSGESLNHERLDWQGHVSLQPLASDGEFRVSNLQAVTVWKYLKDQLSLVVSSGVVNLDGHYDFALRDQPDLKLRIENVAVTDLGVRPDPTSADWITLPTLKVRGSALDLRARSLDVDAVELDDASVKVWLERDGSVNLARLAAGPATGGAGAGAGAGAGGASPPVHSADAPWHAVVRDFKLNNATLAAEDRSGQPVLPLSVTPLNLVLTHVSLDEGSPIQVDLDAHLNGSGVLKVSGSVTAHPAAADLNVTLAAFPLPSLQPFMTRQTSITVLDGQLGAALHVQQKPSRRGPGTLAATGRVTVDHLHTVDNTLRDDLVNWDRLTVTGLSVQHRPDRVAIDTITVLKPYARAIVEPDRSLNIGRALRPPGADASTEPAVAAAPGRKARPAVAAATLPVTIRKVVVTNGQAQFTDLSIQPNFSTGIAALNGTVLGLSSAPESRSLIDLQGQVDEYSPVTIAGTANFLGAKDYLDLDMTFRNMELTTFNPYSGKFAGYNITKGKLTTELKYKIDDRRLDARHHITIDQLEFGAKTDSKDAVSLPIKLAVALLKDRHGVIDLDIPITGTLDDPKFRLGPVIWKVVVNLLTKIVTSPFTLLGKLFGGGPDMQFIDFNAGSAALDAAARQKITAMTKALVERPQLQIELPIAVAAAADRPAIVEQHYAQELAQLGGSGSVADEAAQVKALTRLYTRDLGAAPQFPAPPAPAAGVPPVDVKAEQIKFLQQAIHDHIVVSDDDLKSLAQARAQALQQALLSDGQVDPTRVFLVANDKVQAQGQAVRLELTLR